MNRLTFEPLIPASLWLLLAVAAGLLLAWYAAGRPSRMAARLWFATILLMTAGIAGVLAVLLNPTWIDPIDPPAGKPLLTILVDESASMGVADADGDRSRFEAAREMAGSLSKSLPARFDVRIRSFSTELAPADVFDLNARRPNGTLTDLAGALVAGVEKEHAPGQAVVLLSDGIHNAGPTSREVLAAVRTARAAGAPVYTCTVGRSDAPDLYDLAAEIRSPRQLAYVGQKVPITVRVHQHSGPGGAVDVTLLDEGKPIDTQTVTFPLNGPAEAKFTISRDAPGLYRYEARVAPQPGELIEINNTALQFLEVVDQPIRVLLLEGKPYWDSKFLMRTMAADPVLSLDSIVRMTEGRYLRRSLGTIDSTASAPAEDSRPERWQVIGGVTELLADADSLDEYQIVVLGRDTEVFLSDAAATNLRRWVSRQGGALVCYRGSPAVQISQRFAQILPVEWSEGSESRFHVDLTDQGRSIRWLEDLDDRLDGQLLARLPSLATVSRIEKPRPLATVLATANSPLTGGEYPVITTQNYGTGRVVVIEGAGMWRWAFLPPQHQEYGSVYGGLWQSLMRWLVSGATLRPGQQMDLRCDHVIFEANETASATLLMSEEAMRQAVPSVELRLIGEVNPIGSFAPTAAGDEPGVFRVVFGKLPPAEYEAQIAGSPPDGPLTRFDVRAPVREQIELAARPDLMSQIAERSGGAVLSSGSPRELLAAFEAFQKQARPERVRRVPAWDRWYLLLAVLAVWAGAWGLRRAGGLI